MLQKISTDKAIMFMTSVYYSACKNTHEYTYADVYVNYLSSIIYSLQKQLVIFLLSEKRKLVFSNVQDTGAMKNSVQWRRGNKYEIKEQIYWGLRLIPWY